MFIEKIVRPKYTKKGLIGKSVNTTYAMSCDECQIIFETRFLERAGNKRHFCSMECLGKSASTGILLQDKKELNMAKFGTEFATQSDKVKNKTKATNLERYGTASALQNEDVKNKSKQTCMERYGVDNVLKSKEIRSRRDATIKEKYGVDHISQSEEIKNKKKETMIENHGVEYTFQLESSKAKTIEKYGTLNIIGLPEIRQKIKETNMERYGVENVFANKEIQEKIKETNMEKYGVENIFANEGFQEKLKETNLELYGVENASQREDVKEKMRATNFERYGSYHAMRNDAVKSKIDYYAGAAKSHETKKANGTYGKSKEEDRLYDILLKHFNANDITRQCSINTWSIDFYIKPLDAYVEYNGSYYHGTNRDIEIIKSSEKRIDQNIYKTFQRDIAKKEYFSANNLKLIIITDENLETLSEDQIIISSNENHRL